MAPSRGGATHGPSTHQHVAPSRGGASHGPSTRSEGQPVALSRGGATHGPSTRSGGQPVAPSRGGATHGHSTHSGGQPVAPSRGGATHGPCAPATRPGGPPDTPSLRGAPFGGGILQGQSPISTERNKCRGCSWVGISLRSHLKKTSSNCQDLYNMEELEKAAKEIQKQQRADWHSANREERNERKRQQRHVDSEGSPNKKPATRRMSATPRNLFEEEPMPGSSQALSAAGASSKTDNLSKELMCDICEDTFTTNRALNRHISEIHDGDNIPCPKCQKGFSRKDRLREHLESAHDIKPDPLYHSVECPQCAKKLSTLDNLERHISDVHEGVKPFTCPVCEEDFSRRANLNQHISEVHQGAKPFTCPVCDKDFSRRGNLKQHMSEVHEATKPIPCLDCQEKFARSNKMRRHVSDVHRKEKSWECDQCIEDFSRWENLDRHLKSDSHTCLYECQYCSEEDLRFKSDTEAKKKHFIADTVGAVYTCVNEVKKKKDERQQKEREKKEAARKKRESWEQLPEEEKENFRKQHREERKEEERRKFPSYQWSEKMKHEMLKKCLETLDTMIISDQEMVWWLEEKQKQKEAREKAERIERGEITEEQARYIIKDKEEHDHMYRPYDFDDSFICPMNRLPIHYPVRSKCGHLFDKLNFTKRQKESPQFADMCPMNKYDFDKKERYGCFEKVHLSDLETDSEMSEEIDKRKEKRKRDKEAGLWKPPGKFPYGHVRHLDDKANDVCRCDKCDKIYNSDYNLRRHYRDHDNEQDKMKPGEP